MSLYDEVARFRDLEKSYLHILKLIEEFKKNNLAASFTYRSEGLSLIIREGEYPHIMDEIKRWGLHLIYFKQTLDRIALTT